MENEEISFMLGLIICFWLQIGICPDFGFKKAKHNVPLITAQMDSLFMLGLKNLHVYLRFHKQAASHEMILISQNQFQSEFAMTFMYKRVCNCLTES
jgi:hypothetical protein